jgi:Na+-transporting NADH:ubiquinone oxidoreductase subunit F
MIIVLLSIAVTTGLFLVLAGVLLVAERRLVHYGVCRISVNHGKEVFSLEGGGNLLTALTDNNIKVPASCGGKGMCGYCKVNVLEGGGDVLPTEKPFLSRRDIASGMRLACQVKVRQDLRVAVPDFLDIVADIVRHGTYDKSARWRFRIQGEAHESR